MNKLCSFFTLTRPTSGFIKETVRTLMVTPTKIYSDRAC